ncbi:MAG: cytochrome c3 family protein [Bacteroidota bacterium]
MAKQDDKRPKGIFGAAKLGVARKYIFPSSRSQMMRMGWLAGIGILAYFLLNTFFLDNSFVSSGELSSKHATFEADCAKCHVPFGNVTDAKCRTCHEKTGDRPGVYSFASHYVYRSGSSKRIDEGKNRLGHDEQPCASCHPDHKGRSATITQVSDVRCIGCHPIGSFNNEHPEFAFARESMPDDSTLIFTHIKHTKLVIEKLQKERGSAFREQACLHCHNARPDGKSFNPINYDVHCADCHLTTSSETPPLPIKDSGDPLSPGVETLEMIQRRRGPATEWAFYTNPNEFSVRAGGRVVKSPLYHQDPWVMENLRQIRHALFADLGLSDLLSTEDGATGLQQREKYKKAIETLRAYVAGLRGRPEPEIQADLTRIDSSLRIAELAVADATTPLSNTLFAGAALMENPALTPAQRTELEDVALRLTKPCQECHMVSRAAIVTVRANQRALMRAEFDHRTHILDRRCLDCHTDIPIPEVFDAGTKLTHPMDRAATQNIPRKDNCVQCHSAAASSNACVACHFFHPNKDNRANLQLFVDR